MSLGTARGYYGLAVDATHDGVGATMQGTLGVAQSPFTLSGIDVAYSTAFSVAAGATATFNPLTGAVTGASNGVAQVETATVIAPAGCTSDGSIDVVLRTQAEGSPITYPVVLTTATHTTAALIAAAIRAELGSNPDNYTVGGTGADITLTDETDPRRPNNTSLNLAIGGGHGVTAAPTSTDTTAGVGPTTIYRIAGQTYDTEDFQGKALVTITDLKGLLIVHSTGTTGFEVDGSDMGGFTGSEVRHWLNDSGITGALLADVMEFTPTVASTFTIHVLGAS